MWALPIASSSCTEGRFQLPTNASFSAKSAQLTLSLRYKTAWIGCRRSDNYTPIAVLDLWAIRRFVHLLNFQATKMPKKMGINSKAEEARARKAAAATEKKEKEARDKEESYWREAEGGISRAAKKKEEEAEKKAEALARKAEAKRLAEQEEKELEKYGKRVDKKLGRVALPVPKVTAVELAAQKEQERQQLQVQAEASKKRDLRMADTDDYERLVAVENTNRVDNLVDARSLETALAQMTVASDLPPDRHPERRLKASFKAFEEAELPRLKEEKPGLTHTQYKDMIWKLWKKSPDNPLNQAAQVQSVS